MRALVYGVRPEPFEVVGLSDPGYFSRQFARVHGTSPREWRQRDSKSSQRSTSNASSTARIVAPPQPG